MATQVGTWTPPARMQGDQKRVDHLVGRPLLVRVVEFVEDFTSQRFPNPKPVVFVDLVDLAGDDNTGQNPRIYINTLWGASAVVDGLKGLVGDGIAYPVVPMTKKSQSGNDYIVLNPLEGGALQFAINWVQANPDALDRARAQKLADAEAAKAQPAQTGPIQPQAPSVPQLGGSGIALGAPAQAPAPAVAGAPAGAPFQAPFQAPSNAAQAAIDALNAPAAS